MAKAKVVQGYLVVCDFGDLAERDGTICQIQSRADESTGSLLEGGAAFWVTFGDSELEHFVPGEFLRPWFPT